MIKGNQAFGFLHAKQHIYCDWVIC